MISNLIICALVTSFLSGPIEFAPEKIDADGKPERHLIVCLDGVGYELMEEMRREGHFCYLRNISPMIAPFPSITNPSMVAILRSHGAPRSLGYEDLYYDLSSNRIKGGLLARLTGENLIKGTFREKFNFHPSALTMTLEYMLSPISCWLEARWAILDLHGKFLRSPEPTYLAYIGATDCIAHTAGKRWLKDVLKELDAVLSDIHTRYPGVRISMFSDHGNKFAGYKRASFDESLRSSGFRIESKLSDPFAVVRPLYGLIGSAIFYSHQDKKHELAQALARHEGVDFACFKAADEVYLVSRDGHAKITRSGGKFAYEPETSDPLKLKQIMQKMRAEGSLDEKGFADDATWFAWTKDHIYPDPLHRLWSAFEQVINPASVIANLKDGYYAGNQLLDLFVILRATHGNLQRSESLGFAASTDRFLPDYVRAQDLWMILNGIENPSQIALEQLQIRSF